MKFLVHVAIMCTFVATGSSIPPTKATCPDCISGNWTCPRSCSRTKYVRHFLFKYNYSTCLETFPMDGDTMLYDVPLYCALPWTQLAGITCANMNRYKFTGLALLRGCTAENANSSALIRETCSWTCKHREPAIRCVWDIDPLGSHGLTDYSNCWVKQTCIQNKKATNVSVVCKRNIDATHQATVQNLSKELNAALQAREALEKKLNNTVAAHIRTQQELKKSLAAHNRTQIELDTARTQQTSATSRLRQALEQLNATKKQLQDRIEQHNATLQSYTLYRRTLQKKLMLQIARLAGFEQHAQLNISNLTEVQRHNATLNWAHGIMEMLTEELNKTREESETLVPNVTLSEMINSTAVQQLLAELNLTTHHLTQTQVMHMFVMGQLLSKLNSSSQTQIGYNGSILQAIRTSMVDELRGSDRTNVVRIQMMNLAAIEQLVNEVEVARSSAHRNSGNEKLLRAALMQRLGEAMARINATNQTISEISEDLNQSLAREQALEAKILMAAAAKLDSDYRLAQARTDTRKVQSRLAAIWRSHNVTKARLSETMAQLTQTQKLLRVAGMASNTTLAEFAAVKQAHKHTKDSLSKAIAELTRSREYLSNVTAAHAISRKDLAAALWLRKGMENLLRVTKEELAVTQAELDFKKRANDRARDAHMSLLEELDKYEAALRAERAAHANTRGQMHQERQERNILTYCVVGLGVLSLLLILSLVFSCSRRRSQEYQLARERSSSLDLGNAVISNDTVVVGRPVGAAAPNFSECSVMPCGPGTPQKAGQEKGKACNNSDLAGSALQGKRTGVCVGTPLSRHSSSNGLDCTPTTHAPSIDESPAARLASLFDEDPEECNGLHDEFVGGFIDISHCAQEGAVRQSDTSERSGGTGASTEVASSASSKYRVVGAPSELRELAAFETPGIDVTAELGVCGKADMERAHLARDRHDVLQQSTPASHEDVSGENFDADVERAHLTSDRHDVLQQSTPASHEDVSGENFEADVERAHLTSDRHDALQQSTPASHEDVSGENFEDRGNGLHDEFVGGFIDISHCAQEGAVRPSDTSERSGGTGASTEVASSASSKYRVVGAPSELRELAAFETPGIDVTAELGVCGKADVERAHLARDCHDVLQQSTPASHEDVNGENFEADVPRFKNLRFDVGQLMMKKKKDVERAHLTSNRHDVLQQSTSASHEDVSGENFEADVERAHLTSDRHDALQQRTPASHEDESGENFEELEVEELP